jgi:hypothetical protein
MKVLGSQSAIRREDHDEFLPSVCATLVEENTSALKADAVSPDFRESVPL